MRAYVQSRFRDIDRVVDSQSAVELVEEGKKEVERMEEYLEAAGRR